MIPCRASARLRPHLTLDLRAAELLAEDLTTERSMSAQSPVIGETPPTPLPMPMSPGLPPMTASMWATRRDRRRSTGRSSARTGPGCTGGTSPVGVTLLYAGSFAFAADDCRNDCGGVVRSRRRRCHRSCSRG